MVLDGLGGSKNSEDAFKFLNAALEGGSAMAAYNIAQAYKNGLGVEVDNDKANEYYQIAVNMGFTIKKEMSGSLLFLDF